MQRKHTSVLRSSSGIGTASPKINAGSSSQNILQSQGQNRGSAQNANSKSVASDHGPIRRQLTKNSRGSNQYQDSHLGGTGKQGLQRNGTASANGDHSDHHGTASKAQQLMSKTSKNTQLAPITNNPGKKAQSLIQKKMKAKDLDRQISSQHGASGGAHATMAVERTPDHNLAKKRMSSTKTYNQHLFSAQSATATPQQL